MRDPEASALLGPLPEEERYGTWHLVLRDGSLVGHGTGGVHLLGAMSLSRPVGRVLAHVPGRTLDEGYEIVARLRGRLGRFVPDGPGPRRYP
jgi:hypothetical protein